MYEAIKRIGIRIFFDGILPKPIEASEFWIIMIFGRDVGAGIVKSEVPWERDAFLLV